MKLIQNNETYSPVYRAKDDVFDEDYYCLSSRYQKSFIVQSMDFQSIYDCLSIQLIYWLNDFEEDRDKKMMEKLLFEIEGLDFKKFFYNDFEWYPYKVLEKYDGVYLTDNAIEEIRHNIIQDKVIFFVENDIQLEISRNEFPKVFNCGDADIYNVLHELSKTKKLYFDGGKYFYIKETEYQRLMLYMNEQVRFLNKIYNELNLREIDILTNQI
jgi:hypothetical protein